MNRLWWMDQEICNLDLDDLEALKTLLPYWGISLQNNKLTGSLHTKNLYLDVRSTDQAKLLFTLLNHTGIKWSDHENAADLSIRITISDKYEYPLSLITAGKIYHPKGMDKKSLDLQKRIHKNIWLPNTFSPLICSIHPEHIETSIEWLSYLIIQHFMKPFFKPIGPLSIAQYERLVTSVLKKINPVFSSYQVSGTSKSQWPSLPDDYSPSKLTNKDVNPTTNEPNHISPFKSQQSLFTPEPFNPFKFNREKTKKSVINPFYRKR